jgi:hypothetical protein
MCISEQLSCILYTASCILHPVAHPCILCIAPPPSTPCLPSYAAHTIYTRCTAVCISEIVHKTETKKYMYIYRPPQLPLTTMHMYRIQTHNCMYARLPRPYLLYDIYVYAFYCLFVRDLHATDILEIDAVRVGCMAYGIGVGRRRGGG